MIRKIRRALLNTYNARHISLSVWDTARFFLMQAKGVSRASAVCRFHLGDVHFYARHSDWVGVEEIAYTQEYGFIRELFRNSDTLVIADLGANIGLFSAFVFFLNPSAVVHSFEPSSETYNVLKRNRTINPHLSWFTYQMAIWKENGSVYFENKAHSTSSRIGFDGGGNEVVPAINLDSLLTDYIKVTVDIMKMDIEGAEETVLTGKEALLEKVDHIIVEIHPYLCNQDHVVGVLRRAYSYLYRIPGRASAKPLILAARRPYPFPEYNIS